MMPIRIQMYLSRSNRRLEYQHDAEDWRLKQMQSLSCTVPVTVKSIVCGRHTMRLRHRAVPRTLSDAWSRRPLPAPDQMLQFDIATQQQRRHFAP
jgi:hypothetical protein